MKHDHVEQRDELVKQGLLRCDDCGDLRIYTYVNGCKIWNDLTINSRGIILNRVTGEIVARPFPKFFNMNQRQDTQERNLPWGNGFSITKKEDGWLGILYRVNGEFKIATRGSFSSDGAVFATAMLKKYNLNNLPEDVTLIFEIIGPLTRIVVDYGCKRDLILLGAYNRHTGEEYDIEQVEKWSEEFGFTLVKSYDQEWLGYCRGQLKIANGTKLEGYVVKFDNGLRVKLKAADYIRRHNLLRKLTPVGVWNEMLHGEVNPDLLDVVDIEYHSILRTIAYELEQRYLRVMNLLQSEFDKTPDKSERHKFAGHVKGNLHQSAMFLILDNNTNKLDQYIMKVIRPKHNDLEVFLCDSADKL